MTKKLGGLLAIGGVALVTTAQAVVMVFTENPWTELEVFPRAEIAASNQTLTVDGDLVDWNPAAFYHFYNNELVKDEFALRVAFAYDERGLWFAARFTDRNPLLNKTRPAVNPTEAWDGDSFQFRLTEILKPQLRDKSGNIALLTIWYDTEGRQPAVHLGYGMDMHDNVVLAGTESGLQMRAVDAGYVVEGFFTYEQLRQKPPLPGGQWRLQVQGNFSGPDGKAVHVVYDCFTKPVSFFRDPSGWGYAAFVKPGETAARLAAKARAEKRKRPAAGSVGIALPFEYQNPAAGFVSLAVRNAAGQIVRTLRMKSAQPAGVVRDTWDGLDDNGQPAPTGAYTIHGISHPGIQSRFITSVHNSGTPPWQGADSSSQWGGDHQPAVAVATDETGNAYFVWDAAEKGHDLIKVNRDGRKVWGVNSPWRDQLIAVAHEAGRVYVANSGGAGSVAVYDAATGNRQLFADGSSLVNVSTNVTRGFGTLSDITIGAGHLFAALPKEDSVRVFALATMTPVTTLSVAQPVALAWNEKTRSLHVISSNALVVVDEPLGKTPRARTLVTGLDEPRGLAVDGAGVSWVAVRGKSQQVRGFDSAGKPVGTVGKPGGRPRVGRYDPAGMLQPAGIAADGAGRLWVAEQDLLPSRQSLWDLKTGRLVQEFFGGGKYAPMMAPDPAAPENVFIHNTRFVVDYDTGSVTPAATVYRADHVPDTLLGAEYRYAFMGQTFQFATFAGKKLAYDGHGGVYAAAAEVLRPLLHIGNAFRGLPGLEGRKMGRDMYPGFGTVWCDHNGDGRFSVDEVRLLEGVNLLPNIVSFGGTFFPGAKFIAGQKIFAPAGLDAHGAPQYPEPEDAPPILTGEGPMRDVKVRVDVWPSLKDDWRSFYAIAAAGGTARAGDGKTDGIYKFTPTGEILWRYAPVSVGFGLTKNLSKPGELFGALRILGLIEQPVAHGGEIIGIMCYRGYAGFLTEDGLFIDHFGSDVGYGPAADYNTLFIESFNGYFFRHARTGKVYLFTGATDGRIIELTGWEQVRRLAPVELAVSAEQHAAAVQAVAAATRGEEVVTTLRVVASAGAPATIAFGDGREARVSLSWTAEHLTARFEVEDPSPWQNASKDWRYDFKGGDAVDIQLGADRKVGKDFLPGDVRVVIAPDDGPTGFNAVALWKRVPPGLTAEPWTYRSPVAEETFERVALLKNVRLDVTKTATGYVAEVTIPWNELHVRPAAGQKWRGDLGVLLSDQSGTRTVLRRYLFNKDTNIVDDVPAESRLAPANWGRLEFE
ncbi:MAG: hypothetical protein PCFJNLEI_01645 [Verrucomicrobiae bacterium]|nr:hypothetical protein [Verrucomicrobiae bacterium]